MEEMPSSPVENESGCVESPTICAAAGIAVSGFAAVIRNIQELVGAKYE